MISELHFKILDDANRELARRFKKLQKARANRESTPDLKYVEMDYFHALQHLYAAVQDAVADGSDSPPMEVSSTHDS